MKCDKCKGTQLYRDEEFVSTGSVIVAVCRNCGWRSGILVDRRLHYKEDSGMSSKGQCVDCVKDGDKAIKSIVAKDRCYKHYIKNREAEKKAQEKLSQNTTSKTTKPPTPCPTPKTPPKDVPTPKDEATTENKTQPTHDFYKGQFQIIGASLGLQGKFLVDYGYSSIKSAIEKLKITVEELENQKKSLEKISSGLLEEMSTRPNAEKHNDKIITIDFTNEQEAYEILICTAKEQRRTPENQILTLLDKSI